MFLFVAFSLLIGPHSILKPVNAFLIVTYSTSTTVFINILVLLTVRYSGLPPWMPACCSTRLEMDKQSFIVGNLNHFFGLRTVLPHVFLPLERNFNYQLPVHNYFNHLLSWFLRFGQYCNYVFVTLGRQFVKKGNSNFFIGVIVLELNYFMPTLSADTSKDLASELVHYAFINEVDINAVFSSSALFYFLWGM